MRVPKCREVTIICHTHFVKVVLLSCFSSHVRWDCNLRFVRFFVFVILSGNPVWNDSRKTKQIVTSQVQNSEELWIRTDATRDLAKDFFPISVVNGNWEHRKTLTNNNFNLFLSIYHGKKIFVFHLQAGYRRSRFPSQVFTSQFLFPRVFGKNCQVSFLIKSTCSKPDMLVLEQEDVSKKTLSYSIFNFNFQFIK